MNVMFRFGAKETVIEAANHADVPLLADIHANGFENAWSEKDFVGFLNNDAYLCLIARLKGGADKPPLGFILVRQVSNESEVISIAVSKDFQGKGIAQKLLDEAVRKLQADRIKTLFLEVAQNNQSAINLYQRSGFKQIAERKSYYNNSDQVRGNSISALVMQLELG